MAMIDFGNIKANAKNNSTKANKADLPKAQFWLNFGYIQGEGTENETFVSLPMGIPLDTMDPVRVPNNPNTEFAQLQAARNNMLEQFIELASVLEPGAYHIIRTEGDLAIQIRRVATEQEAPATDESNPFARPKLFNIAA